MPSSKKSQLAGSLAIIGLIAFTFFLILSLNLLSWPIGQELAQTTNPLDQSRTASFGLLVVNATMLQEFYGQENVPNPGGPIQTMPNYNGSATVVGDRFVFEHTSPMPGVKVAISPANSLTPSVTNMTDYSGELVAYLSPATYQVQLQNSSLNNLSVTLQVYAGKVTRLDVLLNATSYHAISFNLVDSDSSGSISSWESIYALIPTPSTIQTGDSRVYLQYSAHPSLCLGAQCLAPEVSATIVSSAVLGNSQWLQIRPNTVVSIGGIYQLNILTYQTTYTVTVRGP